VPKRKKENADKVEAALLGKYIGAKTAKKKSPDFSNPGFFVPNSW